MAKLEMTYTRRVTIWYWLLRLIPMYYTVMDKSKVLARFYKEDGSFWYEIKLSELLSGKK